MLIWGTNAVCLVIILLTLGVNFILFKNWKRKVTKFHFSNQNFYNRKIYYISLSGILISIYLILQLVAVIRFYIGATTVFDISLLFSFIFLVSIIMGPYWSSIIMLIGNTISYFIYPAGAFLLIFALSQMLGCTISWIIVNMLIKYRGFLQNKNLINFALIFTILILMAILFIFSLGQIFCLSFFSYANNVCKIIVWVSLFLIIINLIVISLRSVLCKRKKENSLINSKVVFSLKNNIAFVKKYHVFSAIIITQIIIYIFCSVICDSIAIRYIFDSKKSLIALITIRIAFLVPIISFEALICYLFLLWIPKSVLHRNIIIFTKINRI